VIVHELQKAANKYRNGAKIRSVSDANTQMDERNELDQKGGFLPLGKQHNRGRKLI